MEKTFIMGENIDLNSKKQPLVFNVIFLTQAFFSNFGGHILMPL